MVNGRKLDVLEVIDLIYAAGLDPAGWEAVVEYLGAALPHAAIAFQLADLSEPGRTNFRFANWEAGALEIYVKHFFEVSPWVGAHHRAQVLVPYSAEDICPKSTFVESEFFVDWIKPYKVGCGATAVKLFDEGSRFATLSMNYDDRLIGRVKDPTTRLFFDLVPHLRRAIEMNRRLAQLQTASRFRMGILDTLSRPAFLLAHDCRITHMNARAEELVREARVLRVTPDGRLALPAAEETNKLRALAAEMATLGGRKPSNAAGLLTFSVRDEPGPNTIHLAPIVASPDQPLLRLLHQSSRDLLAVVHLRQDYNPPDEQQLAMVFGFTPAESHVVTALTGGARLADYAEQTGRSIHTVRLHLKRALAKADCRTQAELMRVVLMTIKAPP